MRSTRWSLPRAFFAVTTTSCTPFAASVPLMRPDAASSASPDGSFSAEKLSGRSPVERVARSHAGHARAAEAHLRAGSRRQRHGLLARRRDRADLRAVSALERRQRPVGVVVVDVVAAVLDEQQQAVHAREREADLLRGVAGAHPSALPELLAVADHAELDRALVRQRLVVRADEGVEARHRAGEAVAELAVRMRAEAVLERAPADPERVLVDAEVDLRLAPVLLHGRGAERERDDLGAWIGLLEEREEGGEQHGPIVTCASGESSARRCG
jgi:hypothetical protein